MLRCLLVSQDEKLGKVGPILATCGEVHNQIPEPQIISEMCSYGRNMHNDNNNFWATFDWKPSASKLMHFSHT